MHQPLGASDVGLLDQNTKLAYQALGSPHIKSKLGAMNLPAKNINVIMHR
jgi:hypothetical protein